MMGSLLFFGTHCMLLYLFVIVFILSLSASLSVDLGISVFIFVRRFSDSFGCHVWYCHWLRMLLAWPGECLVKSNRLWESLLHFFPLLFTSFFAIVCPTIWFMRNNCALCVKTNDVRSNESHNFWITTEKLVRWFKTWMRDAIYGNTTNASIPNCFAKKK